jgi:hypothetical protein
MITGIPEQHLVALREAETCRMINVPATPGPKGPSRNVLAAVVDMK